MKNSLARFDYIFVQDELSEELLRTQGITQCSVAGDTRFDRVSEILDRDNQLDFMETFKNGSLCFVAGSTWPEDEVLLLPYIEQSMANLKFVIAPHKVSPQVIEQLQTNIGRSAMRYSQLDSNKLQETRVLIIDTIGLLTKIYSYADMAYVGGGFVTGLHNTLEPAAFGVPILIGPNFYGFKEAEELVNIGGLVPVNNKEQFQKELTQWVENEEERYALGQKNKRFVLENRGARDRVMEAVRLFLNKPQNSGKNR